MVVGTTALKSVLFFEASAKIARIGIHPPFDLTIFTIASSRFFTVLWLARVSFFVVFLRTVLRALFFVALPRFVFLRVTFLRRLPALGPRRFDTLVRLLRLLVVRPVSLPVGPLLDRPGFTRLLGSSS